MYRLFSHTQLRAKSIWINRKMERVVDLPVDLVADLPRVDELPLEILERIYKYLDNGSKWSFIRASPWLYFATPYVRRLSFTHRVMRDILCRQTGHPLTGGGSCVMCGMPAEKVHPHGQARNRKACPLQLVYDPTEQHVTFQAALEYRQQKRARNK